MSQKTSKSKRHKRNLEKIVVFDERDFGPGYEVLPPGVGIHKTRLGKGVIAQAVERSKKK